MKKYKLVVLIAFVILVVGAFSIGFYYKYQTSPVSRESEKVIVEIKAGSVSSIGDTLYENNLIKSKLIFKIFVKLNGINDLKASTYELDRNMKLSEIIEILEKGNSYNPEQITIRFVEGLNIRKIAKIIAENTNNEYDDVINLMEDINYIDSLIDKYWFLTNEIKDDKIYYPLEGYLFPNTYAFSNKDVEVKTIIEKMLDETDKQLSNYKETIEKSDYSVHKWLTLASIVELEGASADDRAGVAGVFHNRIKDGWFLGSDVTTYYYLKIDDFSVSLTDSMGLRDCDGAYNTRCTSYIGLPIGPISNPGLESIEGTINYKKHKYYYFVADCKGKTYLNKDMTGHYTIISKLKNENNWCA